MAKKKDKVEAENPEVQETPETQAAEAEVPVLTNEEIKKLIEDGKAMAEAYAAEHDNYLRLAAEYDNFRKRTQKEKDAIYQTAQSETVAKFLPVYDNIQRAVAQTTTDTAYAKGVEMTAAGLGEVLEKLGVTVFGEVGDVFDPEKHSAVMHIEDETLGENVIAEVFQKGFELKGKVIRFAMVKVAN